MAEVLVTGASGLVGSHVVRALLARGDVVRAGVRARSRTENLDDLDCERVRCDVLDRRQLRRAVGGVDAVVHVAGLTSLRASAAQLTAVNVDGTRLVLDVARRAGVARVVHTSSVAALGPARRGRPGDERQRYPAWARALAYPWSKHLAEQEAAAAVRAGVDVVVVELGHVLGPGDVNRSSTDFVRRFLRQDLPAYVDGALCVVDARDAAAGHLLALDRGRTGERYVLGGRNFTLDRLFADLGRLSGVEPPAVKLPLPAAVALARGLEALGRLGQPVPITEAEVRTAGQWWAFRSTKAARELGWAPRPHEGGAGADDRLVPGARGRAARPAGRAAARRAAPGRRRRGPGRAGGCQDGRPVAVTLYRCRTPTNWLCPCGRVARELRGRGLEVDEVRVPWRQRDRGEVRALTGQGHVPVAVVGGEAICDSRRIVEHLRWRDGAEPGA